MILGTFSRPMPVDLQRVMMKEVAVLGSFCYGARRAGAGVRDGGSSHRSLARRARRARRHTSSRSTTSCSCVRDRVRQDDGRHQGHPHALTETVDGADRIARTRMRGPRSLGSEAAVAGRPSLGTSRPCSHRNMPSRDGRWPSGWRASGRGFGSTAPSTTATSCVRMCCDPTWHYVARDDLRWLMALSGPRVLARTARRRARSGARRSNAVDEQTTSSPTQSAVEPQTRRDLGRVSSATAFPSTASVSRTSSCMPS